MTLVARGSYPLLRQTSIVLAVVAIGAVALGTNGLAYAQTPDYRIFQPQGAGPHPAVVFASGCSGFAPSVAPTAYERTAGQLRGQGYLVLFADYLGRRGLKSCVSGRISRSDAGKDVVAAATWLKSQPFVDPARISALGWAYGGGAILAALAEHGPDQLSFSRAVVYYPVCRWLRPWKNPTPVLMLLAGADDVAPGDECEEVVKRSATSNAVKIVLYSGAQHAFDVSELSASTTYRFGTLGHDPRAAASAQQEIERFLEAGEFGGR
ncbi:MAG TPA: dienelactone hydrolase family protein [Methylomirabilota bacterium]|nr:dienelactone hydrolase family protein [Methylomirabilota bacterium]